MTEVTITNTPANELVNDDKLSHNTQMEKLWQHFMDEE